MLRLRADSRLKHSLWEAIKHDFGVTRDGTEEKVKEVKRIQLPKEFFLPCTIYLQNCKRYRINATSCPFWALGKFLGILPQSTSLRCQQVATCFC